MRAQKVAQDIDVLNQQVTRLTGTLKLLDRELALTRKLYEQKVVPEIEMLRSTARRPNAGPARRGPVEDRQQRSPRFAPRPTTISRNPAAISPCSTKTSNPRRTASAAPI